MTDAHDHWERLEIRRPVHVPAATPLAWQVEKHTAHADRLANLELPADFPYDVERGDAGDALAVLALRESMRHDIELGRGIRIRDAVELGATWPEVAAALDVPEDEARSLLRSWADGQRHMWLRYEEEGVRPFGLTAEEHAAVIALCERDAKAPAPAAEEPRPASEPVKESTRRYAEELRRTPGKASADGHTGWECTAGASLIASATTPGPGRLGTLHAAIYTCSDHRDAAEERIAAAGYVPEVDDAPPGHRWNPWPCGHLTTYNSAALAALAQDDGQGEAEPTASCAKCKKPFDPKDRRFDGAAQDGRTPFCRACTDRCMSTEIADHWCLIDRWRTGER